MNKETVQLLEYIDNSGHYLNKLEKIRKQFNNIKDFTNQCSYVVMEIVSEEKKFINMSRKNIELTEIANKYFA